MSQKNITKEEYAKRINFIIEYINNHLGEEIELTILAKISNFSPFHFHRIFKAFIGEPVGAFIIRMRVETAARLLRYSSLSIQDIAFNVGYQTPSSLTKVFRQFYAISPTEYRNNKNYTIMKPLQFSSNFQLKPSKFIDLETKEVIFIRLTGGYSQLDYGGAWMLLWAFVKENKLFSAGIEHIAIYHDDPKVTKEENLRTDICLILPKKAHPKGEIGVKKINGGKYAVFSYTGSYDNLGMVYSTIYGKWLPESGYELRLAPGFEKYLNNPNHTEPEKLKTEIYLPIV